MLCIVVSEVRVLFTEFTEPFSFSLDLNAAESGVQHKPTQPGRTNLNSDSQPNRDNCSC